MSPALTKSKVEKQMQKNYWESVKGNQREKKKNHRKVTAFHNRPVTQLQSYNLTYSFIFS